MTKITMISSGMTGINNALELLATHSDYDYHNIILNNMEKENKKSLKKNNSGYDQAK